MMAERAVAPKQLLPLIQQLKAWRHAHGFSQYEAARVLREASIPVTTDKDQGNPYLKRHRRLIQHSRSHWM